MGASVPTAASRMIESNEALIRFKCELEHIRSLVRRLEGDPQPDAEKTQEKRRLADEDKAAQARGDSARHGRNDNLTALERLRDAPLIIRGAKANSASTEFPPHRQRGIKRILMAPIVVCFGKL
jgi:hypothetical protein